MNKFQSSPEWLAMLTAPPQTYEMVDGVPRKKESK